MGETMPESAARHPYVAQDPSVLLSSRWLEVFTPVLGLETSGRLPANILSRGAGDVRWRCIRNGGVCRPQASSTRLTS